MSKLKTSPSGRLEFVERVPALRAYLREAIRLHPRRVSSPLPAAESKIGGRFLWPVGEPWPVCCEEELGPSGKLIHNEPLVALVQLSKQDFPTFPFPAGADLFQLLWCPYVHEVDDQRPGYSICWRSPSEFVATLDTPPLPSFNIVPECGFTPEKIVDLPSAWEFARLGETFGAAVRRTLGEHADRYMDCAGPAPGLKLFGWPDWLQGPEVPTCSCGELMSLLLTVAGYEFAGAKPTAWCPLEDLAEHIRLNQEYWRDPKPLLWAELHPYERPYDFYIGDGGSAYLFYCPSCPGPPLTVILQSY